MSETNSRKPLDNPDSRSRARSPALAALPPTARAVRVKPRPCRLLHDRTSTSMSFASVRLRSSDRPIAFSRGTGAGGDQFSTYGSAVAVVDGWKFRVVPVMKTSALIASFVDMAPCR
jgi:hypothetical protein